MINKVFRNSHDAWVAINLGSRMATRMITIGLLVSYLTNQEVAAWYVFIAIFGLVALAEAGLGRVITRQVAERFSANSNALFKQSDLLFLSSILRLYFFVLVALVIIAYFLGIWWFDGHFQKENIPWLYEAWFCFVLANGVSLYSALYAAILNGLGHVSTSQANETFASFVNLLIFILVAFISSSLLAPALALISSTLSSLVLNRKSLLIIAKGLKLYKWHFNLRYIKVISKRISPELGKYFLMLLSFHLLTSAFVLMLNHYEDAKVVASYGITMQLITLVLTFSNIWLTSSFPDLAAQKGKESNKKLKTIFFSVSIRGVSVLFLGLIGIATLGNGALGLIGSQVSLLPIDILVVVISVVAIEYMVFTLLGQLLVSQSMMRFTYYSVFGSILISLIAVFILEEGYGLVAMFASRILFFIVIIAVPIFQDTIKLFNQKVMS